MTFRKKSLEQGGRDASLFVSSLVVLTMFLPVAVSAAPEEGCSPNALIVRFAPGVVAFPPGMDEGH
ncbi:MAG: hypothetical protein GF355_07440, partial [Candidatus Eisenbacteria bacterium]|nr:hypothetical protein [Candidatus Eisenbacteria bacterium]